MPDVVFVFGLKATVLIVSALASGLVELFLLSFPLPFLALGFALGEHEIDLLTLATQPNPQNRSHTDVGSGPLSGRR